MAYNSRNRLKYTEHIIEVYNQVKNPDIPDSFIVRNIFPKHHIFISYRKWMSIKNLKPHEQMPCQAKLFDD